METSNQKISPEEVKEIQIGQLLSIFAKWADNRTDYDWSRLGRIFKNRLAEAKKEIGREIKNNRHYTVKAKIAVYRAQTFSELRKIIIDGYQQGGRFMVRENMTAKKTRYISVRNDGEETYVENIPVSGRMRDHLAAAKLRLREIQRVMPLGKWSITIEQQWKDAGVTYFQMLDVVTGKLQESVL